MYSCWVYWYSCSVLAKGQGKYPGMVNVTKEWSGGICDISLAGQEAEKMGNVTTYPALWQCLHGAWEIRGLVLLQIGLV